MAYGEDNFIVRFFKWLWSLISGGESRLHEQEKQLKDIFKEADLAKKEEGDEKKETRVELRLLQELSKIHKELTPQELATTIQGSRGLTVQKAYLVLALNIQKLIHTATPIMQEEKTLQRIVNFWRVTRRGLLSPAVKKDVSQVDILFKELRILLKDEEKIALEEFKLVKDEYNLVVKETTGGKKPKQPAKMA